MRATTLAHHHAKFGPDPPGGSRANARERFVAQYINWHHTCSGDQRAPGNHQIWPLNISKTGHASRFSETGGTGKIRPRTAAARPLFGATSRKVHVLGPPRPTTGQGWEKSYTLGISETGLRGASRQSGGLGRGRGVPTFRARRDGAGGSRRRPAARARPGSRAGISVDPTFAAVGRRTKRKPLYSQKETWRKQKRGRPGRPADF